MNKLIILLTGFCFASISYAAEPIEIHTSDDGTKYYLLPETRSERSVWLRYENLKSTSPTGIFSSDALLEFNCRHRYFHKTWVRAVDFNGNILLNESVSEPMTPVIPGTMTEDLFQYVCRDRK